MAAKNTKRRAGDRADGRLLKNVSAYTKFMPYVMPRRYDACVNYEESFKVEALDKMLREERVRGYKGMGFLHFIIAAYIRCLSMLPALNRFVVGRKVYAHNSIEVVMAVKSTLANDTEETMIKVTFDPTDTIYDVYRKMNAKINEVKAESGSNGTDDFANTIVALPRFVIRFLVWVLRVLDYFGLIGKKLLDISPFHGSMIITDLGSLKIGPVYHHIYDFGTLPFFLAFGAKKHIYELDRRGNIVDSKYVDMKFTLDERICDGQYMSKFLQALRYIFEHPQIVKTPPSRTVDDVN